MSGLDEKQVVDGGMMRLSVKWADPELQSKKRRAQKDSNAENRMVGEAEMLGNPAVPASNVKSGCYSPA